MQAQTSSYEFRNAHFARSADRLEMS